MWVLRQKTLEKYDVNATKLEFRASCKIPEQLDTSENFKFVKLGA